MGIHIHLERGNMPFIGNLSASAGYTIEIIPSIGTVQTALTWFYMKADRISSLEQQTVIGALAPTQKTLPANIVRGIITVGVMNGTSTVRINGTIDISVAP